MLKKKKDKYYKIIFDDIEQIIDDGDYDKVLDDDNYFYTILENEKKYLLDQGIPIIQNGSNFIVSNSNNLQFKYIRSHNITQCDEKGKITIAQDTSKYKNKIKIIIDYLKSMGVQLYRAYPDKNYIIFACPICNKSEMKCCISIKSLNIKTFSNTDCNNKDHWEQWEKWKFDIEGLENPDFKFIKWNEDFVIITCKYLIGTKTTMTLREFNSILDNEEIPEIINMKVLDIMENLKCLLNHYSITLKFNVIKRRIDVFVRNQEIRTENENFETYMTIIRDNCIKKGFKINKEDLLTMCYKIALENKYNPIENYLKECHKIYLDSPTDKEFKKLCKTVKTIEDDKDWYLYHSLLQMVYIGCRQEIEERPLKNQFLPVFQGNQGGQKTTWFMDLLPKQFKYEYFYSLDSFDSTNKDHIIQTSTNWLVEIAEIASTFKKSSQEALKNYITNTKDTVRTPYAREAINIKRRVCFCGTVNDFEYLRDTTGNRRYLTIGDVKLSSLKDINIDLVWGYFYDLYLKKKKYWHDEKDIKRVEINNSKYVSKKLELLELEEKLILKPDEEGSWYTASEIFDFLNDKVKFWSVINLGKLLKKYNVVNKYNKSRKTYMYFVKLIKEETIK